MSFYLSPHERLTYLLCVILINFSYHSAEAADSHTVSCALPTQWPNASGWISQCVPIVFLGLPSVHLKHVFFF